MAIETYTCPGMSGGVWGTGGGLIGIILVTVAVGVAVLVVMQVMKQKGTGAEESALDIASRRLANGEITEKEYDHLRKKINPGGRKQ